MGDERPFGYAMSRSTRRVPLNAIEWLWMVTVVAHPHSRQLSEVLELRVQSVAYHAPSMSVAFQ